MLCNFLSKITIKVVKWGSDWIVFHFVVSFKLRLFSLASFSAIFCSPPPMTTQRKWFTTHVSAEHLVFGWRGERRGFWKKMKKEEEEKEADDDRVIFTQGLCGCFHLLPLFRLIFLNSRFIRRSVQTVYTRCTWCHAFQALMWQSN